MIEQALGAVFEINLRSADALRVSGKSRWACVTRGGTDRRSASTSAALAEHNFPLTERRFISKTAPRGVALGRTDGRRTGAGCSRYCAALRGAESCGITSG